MSGRHFAPDSEQPERFAFTKKNMKLAEAAIAKYPPGRQQSAALPLLDLAQRQVGGWLPKAAIRAIAERLKMSEMRAFGRPDFATSLVAAALIAVLFPVIKRLCRPSREATSAPG